VRLARTRSAAAIIPTSSMADIAFLLTIFFLMATVHHLERTTVAPPLSHARTEARRDAVIVRLLKDSGSGTLTYQFWDGRSTTIVSGPDEIYLEVSRATYRYPSQQFILEADSTIYYEKIDELLDRMRRGGVQNVLLLTHQRTIGEDAP
jgi:biopolymer transport protein ExbD